MTDKTAEQLRACREAFEVWIGEIGLSGYLSRDSRDIYVAPTVSDYWEAWEASWNISRNTRADSGEAVAWSLAWPIDIKRGSVNAMTTFGTKEAAEDYARRCGNKPIVTPLFTHPRATAVDARYVTVKHPRFFNEEENNAWHRALPDIMAAFDAIAAIASREGE